MTPLQDAELAAIYGGKASGLARCLRAGLPVPDGYALSADEVAAVVDGGLALGSRLEAGYWAVRSSAVDEDGAEASFAGQHLTRLNTPNNEVDDAIRAVAASGSTAEARAYRARMGRSGTDGMAIVLQRMIDAEVAGVCFTRHPVSRARELVIEAAWGLGEGVVAALMIPDTYRLSPEGRVLERRIGHKDVAVRRAPSGSTVVEPVPALLIDAPSLSDAQLSQLHALAARTMAHCGEELDLEWCFATDGTLYLLQQRPLTR